MKVLINNGMAVLNQPHKDKGMGTGKVRTGFTVLYFRLYFMALALFLFVCSHACLLSFSHSELLVVKGVCLF